MHAVSPFHLQGIEYEMKKAVAAENNEDLAGLPSKASKSCRADKAEEKAGLGSAIESQVVGVEQFQRDEAFEEYPRQIGDDAGDNYPNQPLSSEHSPVQGGLNAYVAECVWQGQEKGFLSRGQGVKQMKFSFSGTANDPCILVHSRGPHKVVVEPLLLIFLFFRRK